MTRRERIIQFAAALMAATLAALAARYGIVIPPPLIPAPPHVDQAPEFPRPKPPNAEPPSPQPEKAIVRIQFGNAGCTATVIGPRREDGRWWLLTAAHCVAKEGARGNMRLLDGRSGGVVVAAVDRRADCCWLVTESNSEELPFALLARSAPAIGSRVWHAGYGVDKPGNREEGEILSAPNAEGQVMMMLSVSSGDSGGGIALNQSGEVVSCVCCTERTGVKSRTWGAGPEAIARAKPTVMALDDWTPIPIPHRDP